MRPSQSFQRPAVPSIGLLLDQLRVPSSSPSLRRLLTRLPRSTVIQLALRWLAQASLSASGPGLHKLCLWNEAAGSSALSFEDSLTSQECASSLPDVTELYEQYAQKGGSKREVVDRILEVDWKDGLSLWQLATIDTALLVGLDGSSTHGTWTALRATVEDARTTKGKALTGSISKKQSEDRGTRRMVLGAIDGNSDPAYRSLNGKLATSDRLMTEVRRRDKPLLPQLSFAFLKETLLYFVSPAAKIHVTSHTLSAFPDLSVIRISSLSAPYGAASEGDHSGSSALRLDDEKATELLSKSIWLAVRVGSPHIFVSFGSTTGVPSSTLSNEQEKASGASIGSWRRAVLQALSKALQAGLSSSTIGTVPHHRSSVTRNQPSILWKLQTTNLSAKGLSTLLRLRGTEGSGACQGSWSRFVRDETMSAVRAGEAPKQPIAMDNNPLDADSLEALKSSEQLLSEAIEAHDARKNASTETMPDTEQIAAPEKPPLRKKRALSGSEFLDPKDRHVRKRLRILAEARFGNSARPEDGTGIERLTMRLKVGERNAAMRVDSTQMDPSAPSLPQSVPLSMRQIVEQSQQRPDPSEISFTSSTSSRRSSGRLSSLITPAPNPGTRILADQNESKIQLGSEYKPSAGMTVTFRGKHVHAGIRLMVEKGRIDGRAMPGWMTGEGAVSIGVIESGPGRRLRGARRLGL